jgi:phenylalanyl-tRNA synthetase beta chain
MELGPCEFFPSSNQLRVTVPPTRSDVLHEVDVIEDIAIAYGYNNIRKIVPATNTVGKPLPLNHLSDLLRQEIARDGFVEVLTHGLCSIEENFELLNKNSAEFDNYVTLSNPCNMEYQMVRTSLLPGMLKTLKFNRSTSFSEGVRLFEVSDVVIKTGGAQTDAPFGLENPLDYEEIGARNERRVICCYSGPEKVFETIHGTVDRIMRVLQIAPHESYALNSMRQDQFNQVVHTSRDELCYTIQAFDDSTFFPGRCGRVVLYRLSPAGTSLDGQEPQPVGLFGILHPTVLGNYSLSFPTSVVELELEKLL